jgi:hypothetical protein
MYEKFNFVNIYPQVHDDVDVNYDDTTCNYWMKVNSFLRGFVSNSTAQFLNILFMHIHDNVKIILENKEKKQKQKQKNV